MPRPLWDRKPRLKTKATKQAQKKIDPATSAATVNAEEKAVRDLGSGPMAEAFKAEKKNKKGK